MGHAMEQPLSSKKEKVILYLLGIDKKWTRGGNNQWVEYREEEVQKEMLEEVQEEMQEEVKKTKKGWKFWKRE